MTRKKLVFLLILINIFHLALWTYIGTQKGDYHTDEYLSFVMANNYRAATYDFAEGQVYPMNTVEVWSATSAGHRFDLRIPYYNNAQGDSSNPPLYQMLVHLAYSFVPGVFSNWPALILNFLALTFAAYSVFFLTRTVWADDAAALFVMAAFGTMYGVVNMAVFFRAYCFLMMWAGWLVLWHLREKKNHLLLVPLVLFGVLTHYYFLFLLAIVALYYGIGLIVQKKWGDFWLYIGSLAVGAGLCLLAYPYLYHDFIVESLWAFNDIGQSSAGSFGHDLAGFARLFLKSVGGDIPTLMAAVLVILAAGVFLCAKRHRIPREKGQRLAFLAVPALLYLAIVARVAPYIIDRYFALILPAICVVFWGLFFQAVMLFGQAIAAPAVRGRVLAAGLLLVLFFFGWRRATVLPDHCYQDLQGYHDVYAAFLPEGNNVSILHVHGQYTKLHLLLHYQTMKNAKYLQVLPFDNLDLYTDFPEDGYIILLTAVDVVNGPEAAVSERLREISGKEKATYIGVAMGGEAWLLE